MKKFLLLPLCLLSLLLSACDDTPGQTASSGTSPVRASVAWASLPAPESGVRTNPPHRTIVALLDTSGSMADTDCAAPGKTRQQTATAALVAFAASLRKDDELGIVAFGGETYRWVAAIGPVDGRLPQITEALDGLEPDGGTPLGGALGVALNSLHDAAAANGGMGDYILVPVTDGQATDGSALMESVHALAETPVELHTIGLCVSNELSDPRWGSYSNARNADELNNGLAAVIAEAPEFKGGDWTQSGK